MIPIVVRRLLCTLLVFIIVVPGAAAAPKSRKAKAVSQVRQVESAPFSGYRVIQLERGKRNHLLMRARIDGEPAVLGVDTGAPVSVLNLVTRRKFTVDPVPSNSHIPQTARIGGETVEIGVVHNLEATGYRFGSGPVALIDLSRITTGEILLKNKVAALDGIFGADILLQHHAIVSCGDDRVYIPTSSSRTDIDAVLRARGYSVVPLDRDGGHFTVPCLVNRTRYRLIVDTGAFATLLDAKLLRGQGISGSELPYKTRNVHGDASALTIAKIKSLKIGDVDLRNRIIGITDLSRFVGTRDDSGRAPIGGLLGNELLTHYAAYVDLDGGNLYLRKP